MISEPVDDATEVRDTRYIARVRMKVGKDANGNPVYRDAGDEVPEAHGWPWGIRDSYLRNHRLVEATVVIAEPVKRGPGRPRKDG